MVGTFEIAGGEFMRSVPASVTVLEAGRTGVRGRFVTPEGQGIAGISVRVDTIETVTDAAGNFLLLDLPAGPVTVKFDATPVNPQYPIWPQLLTLTANEILTVDDWILNPPPGDDQFTAITQNSPQDQVITDERYPGLEIRIPAGVTIVGWDGVPKTRLAVERYDPDKLPVAPPPIPTNSVYQLYFGTAMGGIPSSPIPVTLPNDLGLEPDEQTELWYYDGSPMVGTGEWKQAGTGTVSADGKRIVTDEGSGIPRFCGVCGLPCFRANQDNTPNAPCPDNCDKNGPSGPSQEAGAPVMLATGQETGTVTDLALDSPMPIQITRKFNNYDAFALIANFQLSLGVHWTLSYDVVLMPYDFGSGLVRLVLPSNVRADFSKGGDGLFRNSGDSRFRGATLTKIGGQANPLPPTAFISVGGSNGGGGSAGASIAPTCSHDNAIYELKFRDGRQWKFEPFTTPTPVRMTGGCPYFLTEMKSREGHTLTLSRDATGKLRQVSNDFGQWVRLEGGTGEVAQGLLDSAGRTVSYEYDFEPMSRGGGSLVLGMNRLTRAVTPDGEYRYTYLLDPVAWRAGLSSASTGGGLRVPASALVGSDGSVCDNLKGGALIEEMQLPGIAGAIRKVYGKSKRVLQEIYPDGRKLTFKYKVAGACVTRPMQLEQQCFGLTCPDEDSLASEAAGNVVTGGRVVEVTVIDDRGNSTVQKLNGVGLAMEVIDGTGQRWKYGRDGEQRITSITNPLGHTWRYQYDDEGNVVFGVDPLGTTTEVLYDQKWSAPRQLFMRAANGQAVRTDLAYNPDHGGLQTLTDTAQQTWGFAYDERKFLASTTDPLNQTSQIEHDPTGQVETLRDPLGNTLSLGYDGAGRLTAVSDALGFPTSFALNQRGQVTTRTDALNQTVTFEYDSDGRLTGV